MNITTELKEELFINIITELREECKDICENKELDDLYEFVVIELSKLSKSSKSGVDFNLQDIKEMAKKLNEHFDN